MCDQEESGASKRLSITSLDDYGVSWGEELSLRRNNENAGKTATTSYYSSFVKGKTKYSLNDTVYLESGNGPPFVGRILSMYQTISRRDKQMIVRWFCRPCDLPEGLSDVDYSENCKEVFLMWGDGARNVVHPASTIRHCSVICTADEDWNVNFPSIEEVAAADHIFDRVFCPGQLLLQNLDNIAKRYGAHHVTGFAGKSAVDYNRPVLSDGLVPEFRNPNCERKESSNLQSNAVGKRIVIAAPHEDRKRHRDKANGNVDAKRKPSVEYSALSLKQDKGASVGSGEDKIKKRSRLESNIGAGNKISERPTSSLPTHIPSDHPNNKVREHYKNDSSSSAAFGNSRDSILPQRLEENWAEDDPKWGQSPGRNDHQARLDATSDTRSVSSTSSDRRLRRDGEDSTKSPYPIVGHVNQPQKSFSSPAGAQEPVERNSLGVYRNGGYGESRISDLAIRSFGESSAVGVETRGQTLRQGHFDKQSWKAGGGSKTLARNESPPLASAEKRLLQGRQQTSEGNGSGVVLLGVNKSGDSNEKARSPLMIAKHEEVDFATMKWPVELTNSAQKNNVRVGGVQQTKHGAELQSEHPPLSRIKLENEVSPVLPIERQADKTTELANDIPSSTMEHRPTEIELHDTAEFSSEEIPKADSEPKKTFLNIPWKESLRLALEQRKAIFLQNLDPWFSSFDVETLVHELLQVPCDARMLPPRSFACYFTGRAVVLFKTHQVAVEALKTLRENWLLWSSDERPVLASWATNDTGKSSPIRGFFSIEEKTEKSGHLRLISGKSSVVTSHSSQENTVEFDLGIQWRLLQERHKLVWSISAQSEQKWEKQWEQNCWQRQEQEREKRREEAQSAIEGAGRIWTL